MPVCQLIDCYSSSCCGETTNKIGICCGEISDLSDDVCAVSCGETWMGVVGGEVWVERCGCGCVGVGGCGCEWVKVGGLMDVRSVSSGLVGVSSGLVGMGACMGVRG